MHHNIASLEIIRWGYANIPGALFHYGQELDLEIEDIGVLAAVLYTFERTRPLFQTGVSLGQVLQVCPLANKSKLSRRLNRLEKIGLIVLESKSRGLSNKHIFLEPLFNRLENLILRDHSYITAEPDNNIQMKEYQKRIEQLEQELEKEKQSSPVEIFNNSDGNYKKVADFISKKTGNLLSVKMANELKKWLEEMAFTPEFLLCMLELCFERNIYNPREISRIARDLKEYSVNSVEGLELYFQKYIDEDKSRLAKYKQFDPDLMEFGQFTGVDMNAEARKNVYYKWRYDWGFSHNMIMKAGEIMCQRTKNGGLEYIDSVLNNWMTKEIRSPEDAEREIKEFKAKKVEKSADKNKAFKAEKVEYELYVPPSTLEELKSKV
ncbi:MAG: DnaD domain protein [Syntrophomonadaceae bacterium]|nr:DnaD domain protein [Syntrophomonadaceae bacterium]